MKAALLVGGKTIVLPFILIEVHKLFQQDFFILFHL